MPEEKRETTQGEKSVYVEKGDVKIVYPGGKQINKCLGILPLNPALFLGRENELKEVHDKLFAGNNLLLLVNGEGGIGKTTFASKYYHTYHNEYTHIAWIVAEKSLHEAILTLAFPLQVTFPDGMRENERLQTLLCEMAGLQKPCLLVIDNANSLEDLESHCLLLNGCKNFHLLLTTRITQFEHPEIHPAFHAINHLDEEYAIQLFKAHYPAYSAVEDDLLRQILQAAGYNTLVIELLAKNLGNFNNKLRQRYALSDLLSDLQKKGLFGLSQSDTISTAYQGDGIGLRKEKPEAILAAMYNLTELEEPEKALLSVFAVLPAEPIAFTILEELLPSQENLDKTLLKLAKKGWIEFNDTTSSFKCSPVVQEVTRRQNGENLFEHCELLVDTLIDKLDYEGDIGHFLNTTYNEAILYTHYAESILRIIRKTDEHLARLAERIGNFRKTTGNLDKALIYFELFTRLIKELHEADPQNLSFKNDLAVSYSKLGETHSDLGNLNKALTFFDERSRLGKELYEAYPQNVSFKNGLAISYSKLGVTHSALGNLDKALTFFDERSRLGKELYEAYPQNVSFKNGLAISYEKLGVTHSALGNLDKALTFFDERSRLGKELYEAYPQNVSFKNGLAISYSKLGDTHSALGNIDKALTFFDDETRLFEELYEAYPQNVSFKNGLAISYEKLGVTHSDLGNLDKALTFFDERSRLGKELYEAYPQNVSFKNGLAISYVKLGVFNRDKRGDAAKARGYLEQAKTLWAELVESSPSNAAFQKNWSSVNRDLDALQ
jgi:tetratricopeptide (TPR) repeat protein